MHEWFFTLVGLCALQRLVELLYSARNQQRLRSLGFTRSDSTGSYFLMVLLHGSWFLALVMEPFVAPWKPALLLTILASIVFLCTQLLRWWTLFTLGVHWNVNVMAPGSDQVGANRTFIATGPYRYLRHPNYAAVILEFASLPLVGGCYLTCLLYSILNALILRTRIHCEESQLSNRPGYVETFRDIPRFIPRLGSCIRISRGKAIPALRQTENE